MTYTLFPGCTASQALVVDATGQIISPTSGALWTTAQAWIKAGNTPNPVPVANVATLAGSLIAAASAACATIIGQAVPDATHQLAYLNASGMLGGTTTPPTNDPPKTAFNAMASANGLTPAAFAVVVSTFASQSLQLSVALAMLENASAAATTSAQLATALSVFQAAISSVVTALNAANPPVPIVAPAAIVIVGINA